MIQTFCERPFARLKVTSEGNASMCCFQERACLGNILTTSLEEMWNSDLANDIRKTTSEGQLHKTCQIHSCPFFHIKQQTMGSTYMNKFPVDLEIDLPNQHCNIGGENPTPDAPACLMCERHLYWVKQEDRLEEICGRLRPYVTHLRSLHIQGVAEAFWKDRIFDILQWLNLPPGQDQIVISTTTNGTILTEPRRRRFLKYPRTCLTFSVDAATPATFRLIRRVDMFHRVRENLLAYSRERNPLSQHMTIHNNINLLNINEVIGMVELAAQAQCPIDFNPTYSAPSICVEDWNVALFKQAQEQIIEAAQRLGVRVTFMRPLTIDLESNMPMEERVVSTTDLIKSAKKLAIPVKELLNHSPPQLEFQAPLL